MKPATLAYLCLVLCLSACEPKAPEKPNKPPTPSATSVVQEAETRPHLTSHINAAGVSTKYSAFFDGAQLTEIKETYSGSDPIVSAYHYRGARLLKYEQAVPAGASTLIELDEQGRVQRAVAGTRELAAAEIEAIRSRAQLLRSHALAQQASRMHAH